MFCSSNFHSFLFRFELLNFREKYRVYGDLFVKHRRLAELTPEVCAGNFSSAPFLSLFECSLKIVNSPRQNWGSSKTAIDFAEPAPEVCTDNFYLMNRLSSAALTDCASPVPATWHKIS